MNLIHPLHATAGRSPWTFWGRLAASLIAAGLAFWIGEHVFLGQPVTTDENSYLFQARTFSELRLRRPVPQPPEIYQRRMMIADEKVGWVSRYPPAHSLWLIPGVWLGDARLAIAMAAGLSVWFLTGCAGMLGGPVWPTVLFLLSCPFFLMMHGTLLSHTSGMTAVAIMLWGYLRWRLRDRMDGAVIAGLAWSVFYLNRTYTAMLVAIPFALDALFTLWRYPDRRQWLGAGLFAGCAALGALLYLGYNHLITGSAFLPPFIYYNDNMTVGFGGPMNHTWGKGLVNLVANARLLDHWVLLGGGALWLFGLLALLGWTRRWSLLALGGILVIPAGYLFFCHPGVNTCGPFYYFETLPFFALVWMLFINRLFGLSRAALRRVASGALLAGMVAAAALSFRFMRNEANRISGELSERARLHSVLHSAPSNSFVIVEDFDPDAFTDFVVFNPRGLASDPLLFVGIGGLNPTITRGITNRAGFFLRPDNKDRLAPITNRLALVHRVAWYDIQHQTGRATGPGEDETSGRQAVSPADPSGYLAMGYYMMMPPGCYLASFDMEITVPSAAETASAIEISADHGRRILSWKEIGGSQLRTNICLAFDLADFTEIEPRVFFGGGNVTFRGFVIADRDQP